MSRTVGEGEWLGSGVRRSVEGRSCKDSRSAELPDLQFSSTQVYQPQHLLSSRIASEESHVPKRNGESQGAGPRERRLQIRKRLGPEASTRPDIMPVCCAAETSLMDQHAQSECRWENHSPSVYYYSYQDYDFLPIQVFRKRVSPEIVTLAPGLI